jgi:hypothetical protein
MGTVRTYRVLVARERWSYEPRVPWWRGVNWTTAFVLAGLTLVNVISLAPGVAVFHHEPPDSPYVYALSLLWTTFFVAMVFLAGYSCAGSVAEQEAENERQAEAIEQQRGARS